MIAEAPYSFIPTGESKTDYDFDIKFITCLLNLYSDRLKKNDIFYNTLINLLFSKGIFTPQEFNTVLEDTLLRLEENEETKIEEELDYM